VSLGGGHGGEGGPGERSERRLRSEDRGVVVKEQKWSWSEMATKKLTKENMRFASPGSAGKEIRATG
jgi:hypothetical protein